MSEKSRDFYRNCRKKADDMMAEDERREQNNVAESNFRRRDYDTDSDYVYSGQIDDDDDDDTMNIESVASSKKRAESTLKSSRQPTTKPVEPASSHTNDSSSSSSSASSESQLKSSDSSSESGGEELDHLFDNNNQPIPMDFSDLNVALYPGSEKTLFDLVLEVVDYQMKHKSSQAQVSSLLRILANYVPRPNKVPSYYELQKIIIEHSYSV
jgi:hypothetical protein